MSVVNKMLRDLDQRHGARSDDSTQGRPSIGADLKHGTHSVAVGSAGATTPGYGRRIGLAVIACVVLVGAAWYTRQHRIQGAGGEPVQGAISAPQEALQPINNPVLSSTSVLAMVPVTIAPSRSAPLAARPETTAPTAAAARTAFAPGPVPAVSLRMDSMLSTRPLAAEAKAPAPTALPLKPASLVADTAPNFQRQKQASADALAQAQTLWSAGSQAAAIDLMQQAVDAAERAVKAGTSPPGNTVLLSLVREWTRMQMALGRYGPVWDTLSRLEPVLGNAPDLWGLRGNTAQRLGHHADSVRAYTAALQSHPNEQRWMLGAAVSMAALGQTDQAAAMAEKAQSVGDISREVQTYLHQMGVPLKAR